MADLYPPSVVAPEISLAASAAHRRGVVRLLFGLLAFAATYLALLVGCIAAPVVLIRAALAEPLVWLIAGPGLVVFASLLFVLVRGLVHRPALGATAIEVTATEQPRLFAFLERLAVDAGAPMPDRVSLTSGVNAAMLRRPSLGLFGGPRELVIGLGLINVLDLRELQAVLAHEFGHFAQSSARLGQWAHRSLVLLRQIVLGRDRFDERLARARSSPSTLRRWLVALPTLGVRGIRGLLARLLGRITRSNLVLAREMEFNADLHAVALCGSDAIVEALWRAQRGALAMNSSLAGLRELGKHGVYSDDLYAHQDARWAEFGARTSEASDPMIVALRSEYRYGKSLHFPAGEAPTEVMGYSHPSYAEREANAKHRYVEVPKRRWSSAWTLFDDQTELRRRATAAAYEQLGYARAHEPGKVRKAAEVEERIAEELAEREQGRQYFGFYDNRIVELGDVEALIRAARAADPVGLAAAVEPWRGPSLEQFMRRWAATEAQLEHLRARLREGDDDPGVFELLHGAQAERELQRAEARAGDQATFRWLWCQAEADARSELERRARFLAFVQDHIVALNQHRGRVLGLLSQVDDGQLGELEAALAQLHHDLAVLLGAAESVPLPKLRNLEAGASTREFLLADPLVDAHDGVLPLREWLGVFMPQVTAVHDRLRTLHYKNLGRLLALREQIEGVSASKDPRGRLGT